MPIVHAEVHRRLQREIELQGSLRRAAGALRISPQYLWAVMNGQRAVGPRLARSLKLRRVVTKTITYEPLRRAQHA